eukprot:CAMPEP_0170509254 /NCGR_PEP_ID=MMETSP0208-20121228/64905_1 /TAXON_ID=197538 /ORGANISM="Strombidium inclinatum, Strain S3" /LENGTH=91 /DNA_ID=CAMNT_0010792575 /DNA_START=4123 /DNA_END=4398 /DNA_ORIENTATION=-
MMRPSVFYSKPADSDDSDSDEEESNPDEPPLILERQGAKNKITQMLSFESLQTINDMIRQNRRLSREQNSFVSVTDSSNNSDITYQFEKTY